MPRRKRLAPGQTYGGGGGIDLGSILMSAFGGVEKNPDFNQEAPPPSDSFVGPMPAAKTSGDFYRPKSFMDNARAREMNAEFAENQYSADQEMKRQLLARELGIPIAAREKETLGGIDNNLQLDLLKRKQPIEQQNASFTNQLAIDSERKKGIFSVLQALGIAPTQSAEQTYANVNNPIQLDAAAQQGLAAGKQSELTGLQAAIQKAIASGSIQDLIAGGIAQNKFGAKKALGENEQFPTIFKSQMDQVRQAPASVEAEINRKSNMPLGNGGVFNIPSKKYILSPPKSLLDMEAEAPTSQPLVSQNTPLTLDDLIIDPETKQILGRKSRQ